MSLQSLQAAESDMKDWIEMPEEFAGYKASFSPARLSYSIEVERASRELGLSLKNTARDRLGRDYVGNISWEDSLRLNLLLGNSTPNMKEFGDFGRLLHTGMNGKMNVYNNAGKKVDPKLLESLFYDIFGVGSPYRAEWFDGKFERKEDGKLYVNCNHIVDVNRNLIPRNSESWDPNTLMQDRIPGISLTDYITRAHTKQGLPSNDVQSGDFYFWAPRNGSVARFRALSDRAYLDCGGLPSDSNSSLGVRAVRRE